MIAVLADWWTSNGKEDSSAVYYVFQNTTKERFTQHGKFAKGQNK